MRRAILPLLAVFTILGVTGESTGDALQAEGNALQSQETDPGPTAPPLAPGERFDAGSYQIEVQDAFAVESPDRFGYDEVRVSVAFRHSFPGELPYTPVALTGTAGAYPAVIVRDAEGHAYPIDVVDPDNHRASGSRLVTQPRGVPARWTVGFQVPAAFSHRLTVEAAVGGVTVASWDLRRSKRPGRGWEVPAGAAAVSWGTPIDWDDRLIVTPVGRTILVCGDPGRGPVVSVFALAVRVENTSGRDALWPDVRFPAAGGYAVWRDGSSARFFDEAHAGPVEDPLDRLTEEQVVVPPRTRVLRFMAFVVPRDERFSAVDELPDWVVLTPPSGSSTWVDLTGQPVTDLELATSACASFAPSQPFDVDPRDP